MSEDRQSSSSADPVRGRPRFPAGYGVTREPTEAMLEWGAVSEQLEVARNYWVGSTRSDGRPHAAPVWGLYLDGSLYFSTDPTSVKGRNLAVRPEVVVHLESGDDAVILEGRVERVEERSELVRFADAYEPKYGMRPDPDNPNHGVYRLRPRQALAWRERDFPESATRFEF